MKSLIFLQCLIVLVIQMNYVQAQEIGYIDFFGLAEIAQNEEYALQFPNFVQSTALQADFQEVSFCCRFYLRSLLSQDIFSFSNGGPGGLKMYLKFGDLRRSSKYKSYSSMSHYINIKGGISGTWKLRASVFWKFWTF
jgi:hypothetical protein